MTAWPRHRPAGRFRRPGGTSPGRPSRMSVRSPERTTIAAARAGYSAPVRALTSLGARVQALPPGRADLLLAGAFLLETQVELSFLDAPTGTVLAARGLTLAMALGVAARRRAPLVAAALVFAALTVMEQLGDPANTSLVGPFISAFIVSYSIGANLEGRRLAVGVGLARRARHGRWRILDPTSDDGLNLVWGWLVIVAAPVLAGRLLRDRARLARALRAAASEEDAEPWAERAVAEERSRIAARAARRRRPRPAADGRRRRRRGGARRRRARAGARSPSPPWSRPAATRWPRSGACSACCAARTTSWRSRPQPTLAHVADLVRRARAAGLPVELRVEGEAAPLLGGRRPDRLSRRAGGARGRRARGRRRGRDGDRPLRAPTRSTSRSSTTAPRGPRRWASPSAWRSTAASCAPRAARDGGQALRARLPLGSAA